MKMLLTAKATGLIEVWFLHGSLWIYPLPMLIQVIFLYIIGIGIP